MSPSSKMDNGRKELESFKREINLTEFAATRGYRVDRRESSRTSVVMRHEPTDDKIIVSRAAADQHWTYFSVRDATDNGTIVDFLQRRERAPLGAIRQTLRAWLGADRPKSRPDSFATPALAAGPDREGVSARFAIARDVESSAYLASRGLRPSTLADKRFRGTFRVDARGNVLFPHYDKEGLSGFESKNRGWTSFCPGGVKALWVSRTFPNDDRLVLTESAIDALSHHQLFPSTSTRYASIAGAMNERQPDLVAALASSLAEGGTLILAFDADAGGDALAARFEGLRDRIPITRDRPPMPKDWNDVLKHNERELIRSLTRRDLGPEVGR